MVESSILTLIGYVFGIVSSCNAAVRDRTRKCMGKNMADVLLKMIFIAPLGTMFTRPLPI